MKRTHSFFVIMAFVVAALCLASCEETTPVVGSAQGFYGKWECAASTTPPEGATFWIRKGETIIIHSSHGYDLIHGDGTTEHGSWMEFGTEDIGFTPNRQQNFSVFMY